MEDVKLETPSSPGDLFMATGVGDVALVAHRPLFTGDIFTLDGASMVALVQHPCALRSGVSLSPRLLTCAVVEPATAIRSDWMNEPYSRMAVKALTNAPLVIDFSEMDMIESDTLLRSDRIAIMSQRGVNLLLQRWVHFNARVVIPTGTYQAQSSGPFEEADLILEALDELTASGLDAAAALVLIDAWFGQALDGTMKSHRETLREPQDRAVVRTALRRQVASWIDAPPAPGAATAAR